MAIPTLGITGATAYSPTATWNASITLIGDSENLIGENGEGETATINRSTRQLSQNIKSVYDLFNHSASSSSVIAPGSNEDFNYIIPLYWRKVLRYKLTLTLMENLALNGAYDEYFNFSNLFSMDEIDINLNGKLISCEAGLSVKSYLFHFKNCNTPLLKLRNGTIQDVTGNIGSLVAFENCIGNNVCDGLATIATAATNHYEYIATRGIVKNGTLTAGLNGVYAREISYVMSQDNASSGGDCTGYGLKSATGATIRKYDATQPAGTTGAEQESTGGLID